MKIISYVSKKWTLRYRDIFIATVQASGAYALGFLVDHISLLGVKYDMKQLILASIIVFTQHLVRKLIEKSKIITMQKVDKEEIPAAQDAVDQANETGQVPVIQINSADEGDIKPPVTNDPIKPQ